MGPGVRNRATPDSLAPAVAIGYRRSGAAISGRWHTHPEMAAAGLWTTPSDLARFAMAIQDAWNGAPEAVVSQPLAREMLHPGLGGWGLGLAVRETNGHLSFSHSGGNVGYRCLMVGFADTGQGAVIMTNSDAGDGLYGEILRSIASVYDWPDYRPLTRTVASVDTEVFDRLVGDHAVSESPDVTLEVVSDGARLIVQGLGRDALLVPSSELEYFDPRTGREFSFTVDESGVATASP